MKSPHPEPEVLAELADAAGRSEAPDRASAVDVPPDVSPDVMAHVSSCARCTADVAALRDVRETLRSLPPIPMPDDVTTRIASALRSAAGTGQTSDADSPTSDDLPASARAVSVLPSRSANRRSRTQQPKFAVAAGVVVVLIVAIGIGIAVAGHNGNSNSTSSSAAGVGSAAGGTAAGVVLTSGNDYQPSTIRGAVAALVLARVPDAPQQYQGLHELAGGTSAAAAASAPAALDAAPAPSAAPSADGADASGVPRHAGQAPTAPAGPLADPSALAACVEALVQQPETPILVDYADFQGQPATIIVLRDPDTTAVLDLYVEYDTANCVANGDVGYFASLPTRSGSG